MRRERVSPVITDAEMRDLLLEPKTAEQGWRAAVMPQVKASADTLNRRGRYELQPGRWEIHTRVSESDPLDWSVILRYIDPDGNSYNFVRCNGPHPKIHRNRLEPGRPSLGVTPHVHYLREEYQRCPRTDGDAFAVATEAYASIDGALSHLARVACIDDPDGEQLALELDQ
jgi:hypothetical protein